MSFLGRISPDCAEASLRYGAYDIIGDVHGQARCLLHLLRAAGWVVRPYDPTSFDPIHASHPGGRLLVFTGDLVNKGPDSLTVLRLLLGLRSTGAGTSLLGNHDEALLSALLSPRKRASRLTNATRQHLLKAPEEFRSRVIDCLQSLPLKLSLPMPPGLALSGSGRLHVVHAGARRRDLKSNKAPGKKSRARLVRGAGLSLSRKDHWTHSFDRAENWLIHGHSPSMSPRFRGRVIGLDTGAGEGRCLTMLRADSASFITAHVAMSELGDMSFASRSFSNASE